MQRPGVILLFERKKHHKPTTFMHLIFPSYYYHELIQNHSRNVGWGNVDTNVYLYD